MKLHYQRSDGAIVSWGTDDGVAESALPGCDVLVVEDGSDISGHTHRVDVATKTLLPITDSDVAARKTAELLRDIKNTVAHELSATDRYFVDDFPIDEAARAAWRAYRASLRNCSKGSRSPAEMVAAIVQRPDGHDAFAHLGAA